MIVLASVLVLCGSAALCLAMKRHGLQMMPARAYSPALSLALRVCGSALLVGGAVICAITQGAGVGLTTFFGIFSMVILLIAISLPYLAPAKGRRR